MTKKLIIPLFLAALVFTGQKLVSQEAKIMILEKSDSQALKTAYQHYKAALSAWEQAKTDVAKKYTLEGGKPMAGWEKVEYSVDFRAIVPQKSEYASGIIRPCWNSWTNTTSGITSGDLTSNATNAVQSMAVTRDDLRVSFDGIRTDLKAKEPLQ